MFRSVLNNQQFETWLDYHEAMCRMYEHFDLIDRFLRNPENYHRARLLSRQYVTHRSHFQALTSLLDVQTWLNENHLELFNVPTIHFDKRRNPVSFNNLKFQNVYADPEVNTIARYESMTEEEV